ncbi:MAG: type II toxin-antitoxin system VapC family toxin [Chloroflexota bacterium]
MPLPRFAGTAITGTRSTVTRALVVDASVAIAIVLHEQLGDRLHRLLIRRARDGDPLIVPNTIWVEVVNVLARRYRQSADEILESVATLDGLSFRTIDAGRVGLLSVIEAVVTHRLTAYDAVYLALAESSDADLLTLDQELAAAAGDRALPLGGGQIREARATYRLEPWITWEGLDDYLAAARRAVASRA